MSSPWLKFLGTQCPVLYHMITDRTGKVDQKAVERILEKFEPCQSDKEDCLERQCSALWQYYVSTRHNTPAAPREVRNIADHLFSERGNLSFRPGDLSFLYDLHRSTTDDKREQRIVRRAGETVLRVEDETEHGDIHSYDVMRVLLHEHPLLHEHFVKIYALERSVERPIKMYVLLEAMDGSLDDFKTEFAARDPHFWQRYTRMLLQAWVGLYRLHTLGYSFGHVSLDNLLFKLEWNRANHTAGLVSVKWRCPREMSTEPAKQHEDWTQFAHLICRLVWGSNYQLSPDKLEELRHARHLQPLATLASHILSTPAWNVAQMLTFLQEHSPTQDLLSLLPLSRTAEAYPDW